MSLFGIKTRSKIVQKLREELFKKGFEEIIPQLAIDTQPLEPTIYPFGITWDRVKDGKAKLYLATSPESYLKKAMAEGVDNCFAITSSFRNQEGKNDLHSPEFLMAEWYKKNSNWNDIMDLTHKVVIKILNLNPKLPWLKLSFRNLWKDYLNKDLLEVIDDTKMQEFAKSKGYNTRRSTWEQLFYQIFYNEIEPHIPTEPFFLTDFPVKISRLAKPQDKIPELAQRFELLINKIELADGNTEYFDKEAIRNVMETEYARRIKNNETPQPIDEKFLEAITKLDGQNWAGVGLGVDRLAMLYGKIGSIKEIQEI